MPTQAPNIDTRTRAQIAAQVLQLAQHYARWRLPGQSVEVQAEPAALRGRILDEDIVFADPDGHRRTVARGTAIDASLADLISAAGYPPRVRVRTCNDAGWALAQIFARLAEMVVQRLNQAPNQHFLAFLDLLGAALLPPQPARAPITFALTAGSTGDTLVPAGTQVAAAPAEGDQAPIIFETERELVVTAAQLVSSFARDPWQDTFADRTAIVAAGATPGAPVFQGDRRAEHMMYLSHDLLLGLPRITKLELTTTQSKGLGDDGKLVWERWNGAKWVPLEAAGQPDLRQQGTNSVELGPIPPTPICPVAGAPGRWLRCRLLTPIARSGEHQQGMVRQSRLPVIEQLQVGVDLNHPAEPGLAPDLTMLNGQPIEPGKDFYPFGEKPRLNDTLYLASAEVFSKDRVGELAKSGARVSLAVDVANSHLLPTPTGVRPSEDLRLAWECWNGTRWQPVGTSTPPAWLALIELDPPPPVTAGQSVTLRGTAQPGAAVVIKPKSGPISPVVGEDGRFTQDVPLSPGVNIIGVTATYKSRQTRTWATVYQETQSQRLRIQLTQDVKPPPPVRQTPAELTVRVIGDAEKAVKYLRVTNGRAEGEQKVKLNEQPIALELREGRNELLIEGLDQNDQTLAATQLTVSRVADSPDPDPATGFVDGTYALCQTGVVGLTLPETTSTIAVGGEERYWLRVRLERGDYGKEAIYRLSPRDGATVIPANFRPPILAAVKLGYTQTLAGTPQAIRTYNNLCFADPTDEHGQLVAPFAPFAPAPEDDPALYLGLTLPRGRDSFPQRAISLFCWVDEARYGEHAAPIWPPGRATGGLAGEAIEHAFVFTNGTPWRQRFEAAVLGTRWSGTAEPASFDLDAGASRDVEVRVAIPTGAEAGDVDRGFVRISPDGDPAHVDTARFATAADTCGVPAAQVRLTWQYWNGQCWANLAVRDATSSLTRSGAIELLTPADFAQHEEFGLRRYWLRVLWVQGDIAYASRLRRVLLNTTMAAQAVTMRDEVLGVSDGSPSQVFRTAHAPVLSGPYLQVREPEMPPAAEQATIRAEEGDDAIMVVESPREIWVRWHEVSDFYASGQRDRHYVLDHISGEIHFGDGLSGQIPSAGARLRMPRYQTGGGAGGNRPAGAIAQLKTTVPYIDSAINLEAATGGADAEPLDALLDRAPRMIRHRGRAVTVEDYADLARLASPEVARALCVPLYDLAADPDAATPQPGTISLIVVPRSAEPKPMPSLQLIERVRGYLEALSAPTARLAVVGPDYVRVDVEAEIVLISLDGAGAVEQAIRQRLGEFLHPLTGGLDRAGWDFGRQPHKSDLYALIEAILGVDHVYTLKVRASLERTGEAIDVDAPASAGAVSRFLVYSGNHSIRLRFEAP